MDSNGVAGNTGSGRGKRLRSGVVAAGAAFGMTLAGLGLAGAQTETPTTEAPAETPSAEAPPAEHGPKGRMHRRMGHPGKSMGIHGEFTTRAPGGGYQTVATQFGEVTEVSRSAITVKSEDGYSRTYTVDDGTMVNAGNDGIADVRQGDQVHVMAIVADGKARAVDVRDVTRTRALREQWAPPPRG